MNLKINIPSFVIILLIASSCTTEPVKNESISSGKLIDGKYKNELLGFQFELPNSYKLIEKDELEKLNQNLKTNKEPQNEREIRSLELTELIFAFRLHDSDTFEKTKVNPTLFLTTERISPENEGIDAKEYMKDYRKLHLRKELKVPAKAHEKATVKIGNNIFERHTVIQKGVRTELNTGQYCKILDDYVVIFSLQYGNQEDRKKLIDIISTLKID